MNATGRLSMAGAAACLACCLLLGASVQSCSTSGTGDGKPPPPALLGGGGDEGLPDITVKAERLQPYLSTATFKDDSCAIVEGCVSGAGPRRLLKFTTNTPNIGAGDLSIGNPKGNPALEWSPCHEHYHFKGFALYELVAADGHTVLTGRKQSFCLGDNEQIDPAAGPAFYTCENQGISAGWADDYDDTVECQWLDVTDLPPGDYTLRTTVNPERIIRESHYDNNVATAPVTIPAH